MRSFLFTIFTAGIFPFVLNAEEALHSIPVSEWVVADPPSSGDKVVFSKAALDSEVRWEVLLHDHVVAARKAPNRRKPAEPNQLPFDVDLGQFDNPLEVLQVDDGWLVGDYEGEFGGAVYWFSIDGQKHYKISNHQVKGFVKILGVVCALEGLSHRFTSVGSMICLERDLKWRRWRAHEVARFSADPQAWVLGDHSELYVFTKNGLVVVEDLKDIRVLWEGDDWLLHFAKSMVLAKDRSAVFVGLPQYVGRFTFDSKAFEFLIPDREMIHRLSSEEEKELREMYRKTE